MAPVAAIIVPRRRLRVVVLVAIALLATVCASVAAIGLSLALFTAQSGGQAIFGSKAVFPGERITPAFQVGDSSSGTEVDRSSPFAFGGDGVTTTTSAWSTAFAADRYLEFDLNDSLASGVPVSSASFDLAFASSGAGTACYYLDVRRISSGAVIATHGSTGSPLGCVTGTTPASFSTALPEVSTTSIANDLRIRVFGQESGNAEMAIDLATVGGSTTHQVFTLYPVTFRDAADTTPEIIPWGLAIP
jgi:hypothetical protein